MADGNGSNSTNKQGTTYDLCKPMGEVEGKKQWDRIGTLFIRGNGTGGVVYLKQADGSEVQISVFAKRPRPQRPAAAVVAA